MKAGDLHRILGALDPETDLNDIRRCATTGPDEVAAIVGLLDEGTDNWEQYAAELVVKVVVPLLLEQRDLLLMPASERGWAAPAEMARKVAEQVRLAEQRLAEAEAATRAECGRREAAAEEAAEAARLDCQRREREAADAVAAAKAECDGQLAQTRAECDAAIAAAKEEFRRSLAKLSEQHTSRADQEARRHREERGRLQKEHAKEAHDLRIRISESELDAKRQKETVPGKQAAAAAAALLKAADTAERLAGLRLSQLAGKVRGLFRDRDLDTAMLRVEADGLLLAAKRLRQMSKEAADQGRWPIEFADGEEVQAPLSAAEAVEAAVEASDDGERLDEDYVAEEAGET
jgi:hypothetical protein